MFLPVLTSGQVMTLANSTAANEIRAKTAGIVFFATPHGGSRLANLATVFLKFNLLIDTADNFLRSLCWHSEAL
jgi:hypothetical protein